MKDGNYIAYVISVTSSLVAALYYAKIQKFDKAIFFILILISTILIEILKELRKRTK